MPAWHSGVQGTHSLIDWIILTCREAWPNEEDLPAQVRIWKQTELHQIIRELGMRQVIYVPVFKGPDWATFLAGMKVSPPPSAGTWHWYPFWAQLWDKMLMMLSNPLVIWRTLIDLGNGYGLRESLEIEKPRKPEDYPNQLWGVQSEWPVSKWPHC